MKDRSDDPSHHEQTLLPQSYISLFQREIIWIKWTKKQNKPIYNFTISF